MSVPKAGGGWRGLGSQVNKFEQTSGDDHQMSLAGGGYVQKGVSMSRRGIPCDLSHDACHVT